MTTPSTLLDVVRALVTDEGARHAFLRDGAAYLDAIGWGDLPPELLADAVTLAADTLPFELAAELDSWRDETDVDADADPLTALRILAASPLLVEEAPSDDPFAVLDTPETVTHRDGLEGPDGPDDIDDPDGPADLADVDDPDVLDVRAVLDDLDDLADAGDVAELDAPVVVDVAPLLAAPFGSGDPMASGAADAQADGDGDGPVFEPGNGRWGAPGEGDDTGLFDDALGGRDDVADHRIPGFDDLTLADDDPYDLDEG